MPRIGETARLCARTGSVLLTRAILVLVLVCGMVGSLMAIRRTAPPARTEASLPPPAPKPMHQETGGTAWVFPDSTPDLDWIAAEIDAAASNYGINPRRMHADHAEPQGPGQLTAAAPARDAMPIGMVALMPPGAAATAWPPALQPPSPPQNSGNPELQALLGAAGAAVIAGERLLHPDLVRQFYAGHGNEPFWGSRPEAARALLGAVFRAEEQGLDPALFHAEALSGREAPLPPIARDVLISDAILSYADALAEGAVPRRERPRTEALHPMPIDVVAAVDKAIAAPDPAEAVAALAPTSPEYEAMRRAYTYYHARAVGTPVAQQEEPYPSYAGDDRKGNSVEYEDDAGAAHDRGYAKYPYLSSETAEYQARQLAVALERLRWLPRHMPPKRIMVNIAAQRLQLFEGGRPVFATRVVVGQPTKQTPEFHATIDGVLFNPPWNIPPSILQKEILPKLARDPDYLARHHIRWIGSTAVQQEAGPHSALGRLKFEMSDPYEVYLHDTPERHLFRLADRMKSHGCVRVAYPQKLAALLLHESPLAVARGIVEGRAHAQVLPQPVDVYITYQTVSISPSGGIVFHADPYHRDAAISQLLNRSGELPIAQDDSSHARRG
jgi:murein L,D-transpeptidase YcbB/YkuD